MLLENAIKQDSTDKFPDDLKKSTALISPEDRVKSNDGIVSENGAWPNISPNDNNNSMPILTSNYVIEDIRSRLADSL